MALGMGLNVATKLAVNNSLLKLKIQEGTNVTFWGKVMGSSKDYLIAVATTTSDSISKKFFFSADDGLTFAQLPEVDDFVAAKSALHRSLFTGNPAQVYKDPKPKKVTEDGEEEEEEEEEEEPEEEEGGEEEEGAVKKPKERKLNELERLACGVQSIDGATCVTPKGAYFMTPTSEIKANAAFAGLSPSDVKSLSSYLLFKNPTNPTTLACIRRDGATNNFNFLDPAGTGEPAGVWSIQTDASGLNTSLRSLQWPGYEFTVQALSNSFSGAYFGTGLKNDDVAFMI